MSKADNRDVDTGLAKVQTDGNTFLRTRSVTRLSDWPLSDGRAREHVHYGCPEAVFEHDYDRLVRALTIVAGDKETAADAVQEAFVCLVRRWEHLSSYEDPAGWVRRVALNQIHEHQRSVWRQTKLLLRIEREPPAPEGASTMAEEVWGQLRTLPLKQRTALALYYVGDLTEREVADAMHVSEGTVKQHLHRARQTLRETLEGQR
jgi:RNA polymerase sigma-70 factor (ECF subfamily)